MDVDAIPRRSPRIAAAAAAAAQREDERPVLLLRRSPRIAAAAAAGKRDGDRQTGSFSFDGIPAKVADARDDDGPAVAAAAEREDDPPGSLRRSPRIAAAAAAAAAAVKRDDEWRPGSFSFQGVSGDEADARDDDRASHELENYHDGKSKNNHRSSTPRSILASSEREDDKDLHEERCKKTVRFAGNDDDDGGGDNSAPRLVSVHEYDDDDYSRSVVSVLLDIILAKKPLCIEDDPDPQELPSQEDLKEIFDRLREPCAALSRAIDDRDLSAITDGVLHLAREMLEDDYEQPKYMMLWKQIESHKYELWRRDGVFESLVTLRADMEKFLARKRVRRSNASTVLLHNVFGSMYALMCEALDVLPVFAMDNCFPNLYYLRWGFPWWINIIVLISMGAPCRQCPFFMKGPEKDSISFHQAPRGRACMVPIFSESSSGAKAGELVKYEATR